MYFSESKISQLKPLSDLRRLTSLILDLRYFLLFLFPSYCLVTDIKALSELKDLITLTLRLS